MSQHGSIHLINGTPYDWIMSMPKKSSRIISWAFPETIMPGIGAAINIEWNQDPSDTNSEDAGSITFTLGSTSYSFELQVLKAKQNFMLQVHLVNIATEENPIGDKINLGLIRDDPYFILSGSNGKFTSNNIPVPWMQRNISTLGKRPLREICMPGSHNAGMNKNRDSTIFATEGNCLCQSVSVLGQLISGSRYLDIRPIISRDEFSTGHYSKLETCGYSTWQGMTGQSIMEIIEDINNFTALHHELVILNISHSSHIGDGYRSFNQIEWGQLLDMLLGNLNHLFAAPSDTDLSELPLSKFIGEDASKASVLVLVENDPWNRGFLDRFSGHGFYSVDRLRIYDSYANTMDPTKMINDQIGKMKEHSSSHFFVLSWTLTQEEIWDALSTKLSDLGDAVNKMLYTELLPRCEKKKYPNVIYIDYFKENNRSFAALAMVINSFYAP